MYIYIPVYIYIYIQLEAKELMKSVDADGNKLLDIDEFLELIMNPSYNWQLPSIRHFEAQQPNKCNKCFRERICFQGIKKKKKTATTKTTTTAESSILM